MNKDYHVLSIRINGVTVDLDGLDKARFTDQDVVTLAVEVIALLRRLCEQDGDQVL